MSARAEIESLLRARKLDVTLTSAAPGPAARDAAPTGIARLDDALGGGLPRGHLSEVVGPRSVGRTTWPAQSLRPRPRAAKPSR